MRNGSPASVEYQALQVLRTQVTDLLLPDYPPDAIPDDIALSAAIWTDDPGDPLVKTDMGLIGKTLEPLYFQTL